MDFNLKKEIKTIDSALEKVRALRGVSFKWNELGLEKLCAGVADYVVDEKATEEENQAMRQREKEKIIRENSGERKGFIAQEVREVFPEWVKDQNGYLALDMSELNAVLVEAIKELKAEKDAEINELKATVKALSDETAGLKAEIRTLKELVYANKK